MSVEEGVCGLQHGVGGSCVAKHTAGAMRDAVAGEGVRNAVAQGRDK